MAQVLLTHSYHLLYDRKQARKMQPYPPLGTLYAAALLRAHGISVAVFDTMLNDPAEGFAEALRRHQPKIVAVYEDNFNFLSKMCLTRMREVAFEMLDQAHAAGATVIANGSDATDHRVEYLGRGFDFILMGEAEQTLLELVSVLLAGTAGVESIAGLAYLDRQGSVTHTAPRELIRELDSLPMPARDLIDVSQYAEAWGRAHGTFSLNLIASRGCPYRCNWCAKPIYGNSFHVRAPEHVAREMCELKHVYGARHLWFADDIFALRASWAEQLADAVTELDAAVPFKIQTRVDLMTPRTAAALRRAGCVEVWMGAESGSQRVLDAMEKDTRVEQIVAARRNLQQHGIRACFFLQFGYPGETWADIQKTVEMVRRTRPDDVGISVSYPLPGTVFYERVRTEIGAKQNWTDSADLAMMFRGAYTDEFYRAVHDAIHAEVDSWREPAGAAQVAAQQAWAGVERLEKTCRNRQSAIVSVDALRHRAFVTVPGV
jgi:radical SAM superfamily enzyme YgiQ (UPF0313 family)